MTARYGDRSRVTSPVGSWGKAGGEALGEVTITSSPAPATTIQTLTDSGNQFIVVKVNATSTLSVVAPILATGEMTMFGGGGGGGAAVPGPGEGGGGGGGGRLIFGIIPLSSGSYPVVIGGGGGAQSSGANTTAVSLTAGGGNAGGNGQPDETVIGGGGGSSGISPSPLTLAAVTRPGGSGGFLTGGGGASFAQNGGNAQPPAGSSSRNAGPGGVGIQFLTHSPIDIRYGAGGKGQGNSVFSGTPGPNTASGGNGNNGLGSSGVVLLVVRKFQA